MGNGRDVVGIESTSHWGEGLSTQWVCSAGLRLSTQWVCPEQYCIYSKDKLDKVLDMGRHVKKNQTCKLLGLIGNPLPPPFFDGETEALEGIKSTWTSPLDGGLP